MNSQDIYDLHEMRKRVCTCNKAFLYPAYHEDGCTYKTEGEAALVKIEERCAAAAAQEEGGAHEQV